MAPERWEAERKITCLKPRGRARYSALLMSPRKFGGKQGGTTISVVPRIGATLLFWMYSLRLYIQLLKVRMPLMAAFFRKFGE